ncbi:MAG: nitrate reductase subunit alpha [Propionibacteriaceae bacterium]|jgi:nitrate reductase alpha subunit|nr:nitrate reductase subunit alpha [Propionibacteriaceae bacterium]
MSVRLSPAVAALLKGRELLTRERVSPDARSTVKPGDPTWERFYRDRYAHDKVVTTTHGVNCTGSCSWKVFVKDGLITWEHQNTDYPTTGPDSPEYEPRGCPRGASFSWYEYSPARVRYPYVRGVLLDMYRAERARGLDPVEAWAAIVENPERAAAYKRARGKGGFVRSTWEEAQEIQAAAHVHTIKAYGPDRCVGFTPIPAMSMVSFAAGTRFFALTGGTILSFYDWYCDLPPASPQIWGDQTDVPESADWWNAGYMILWGANLPVTRTPDAHFMTEVRYKGTKVVAVSPDYAENVKFADDWLAPHPGTDGALAQAMGHVILTEFFRDRRVDYFDGYVKRYTDAPFLVELTPNGDGTHTPGKFLTADAFPALAGLANAAFKPVLLDLAGAGAGSAGGATLGPLVGRARVAVPNGTLGDRWGDDGLGRWNLDLGGIEPALSAADVPGASQPVEVLLPRFDLPEAGDGGTTMRRGVPAVDVGGRLATTVFDLLMAGYGVPRDGLPGQWPTGYDDPDGVGTPAWAQRVTGVDAATTARIAREFARNAEDTKGRSMIVLGAGTNHYFHSDTIYRTFISLLTLCGCQGVNGGGWAHYVGQEKARPLTGLQHIGFALDWARPPRHQASTSFWHAATDQWRYDLFGADDVASPAGPGKLAGQTMIDCYAQAVRLGWTPGHPGFNRNPLDLCDEAEAAGQEVGEYIVEQLKAGKLRFAVEDPDDPANFPRTLTLWRANLLGNSAKGSEYFLRHILGTDSAVTAPEAPPERRPHSVVWRDQPGVGKTDLVTTVDFRMTGSALLSDIVLPAATWYEKHDISTTDMHPFIHAFNPAIAPPWQARTDFQVFSGLADKVSQLAVKHLGKRRDVAPIPLLTDTVDELAQPHGRVLDWAAGECEPKPGATMPKLVVTERDYTQIGVKMRTLGPLMGKVGSVTKGVAVPCEQAVAFLAKRNGVRTDGPVPGSPLLDSDVKLADAILAFSGTTNGHLSRLGFAALAKRTGKPMEELAGDNAERQITFDDTRDGPTPVFTSYEWSGSEKDGRRYSPFCVNLEYDRPWSTLTGRQQFYVDHDWMAELGETLPVFRPPLAMGSYLGRAGAVGATGAGGSDEAGAASAPTGESGGGAAAKDPGAARAQTDSLKEGGQAAVTVRYLTPHDKWAIHSSYQDNPYMLALSRGGPTIWMSAADAAKIGVADNDWVEAANPHGVVSARAVVTHRMPEGTVYMYHSKDRNVDVPLTQANGRRGGIHNALTRLYVKPTHLIGGYAQLTYGFNYYGPTGNQRDELTTIRRRSQEVEY